MGKYASDTTVHPDRTLAEIRGVLARYGGDMFTFGERFDRIQIGWRMDGRIYRFEMPLPEAGTFDSRFVDRRRREEDLRNKHQAEVRRRWRVVLLMLRAKLELATDDSGVSSPEVEFLPWTMLPDGSVTKDWLAPQLDRAYALGAMPSDVLALPAGRSR